MNKWYAVSTGSGQGLIVSDNGGANIAVSYDEKDAPLIATAPELLTLVEQALDRLTDNDFNPPNHNLNAWIQSAYLAILKAKGEQK